MAPVATAAAPPVQALLFDLDGTLIDSMPLHALSWRLWHAGLGLPYDEAGFFAATAGRSGPEIMADMFPDRSPAEQAALTERKEVLYREAAERELQAIPGALALMADAAAAGLRQAVCTAAPDANVAVAYARFGFDRYAATTVNPDQGFRGKPHPDLFLEAARRLGVPPAACIVFEDAPLGIEAARRAGMRAVALTTTMDAASFAGYDNLLCAVPDFTAVDLAALGIATA